MNRDASGKFFLASLRDGFGFFLDVKANVDVRRKICRWGSIQVFDGGNGLPDRFVPDGVAGTFLPLDVTDLSVWLHRHLDFHCVIIVIHIFRAVPFGTKRQFNGASVKFHGIAAGYDRSTAIKIKGGQFCGRRRDGRRRDRRGHGFRDLNRFGRGSYFGRFRLWYFHGGLGRRLGWLGRLLFDELHGNLLDLVAEKSLARGEIEDDEDQRRVKDKRDKQVYLRRVFVFRQLALWDHFSWGSVAKSTFGTLACWQTSSTERICLYFVLLSPRTMMFKSGSSERRAMSADNIPGVSANSCLFK